jgi:arginase family enzyme
VLPTLRMKTPFCKLPSVAHHAIPSDAAAAVIGAGYALGTAHSGSENGPYFLRNMSKAHTWAAEDSGIVELRRGRVPLERAVDLGDIDFGDMTLDEAQQALEELVSTLPAAVAPCVIGGDHTVTRAVVEALWARRRRPFTVVQFDHHLDLQIWDGAPGRPDTAREKIFNTNVMSHVSDRIGPGRLIQVGVAPYATVEAGSADALQGLLRTVGKQVCLLSPEIAQADAFQTLVGSGNDVYLSVDIDVLDRTAMSSTGYPANIGLGVRELLRLIDLVLVGNRLIGFDLVEFAAPEEARDPKTLADAGRASLIFLHLLGWACWQA